MATGGRGQGKREGEKERGEEGRMGDLVLRALAEFIPFVPMVSNIE